MKRLIYELKFYHPDNDEIYQSFFITHTCYDCMPKSGKVLLLDARLSIRKAFFALVFNSVRAALIWDSPTSSTIGLITISDFINMLVAAYDAKWVKKFIHWTWLSPVIINRTSDLFVSNMISFKMMNLKLSRRITKAITKYWTNERYSGYQNYPTSSHTFFSHSISPI